MAIVCCLIAVGMARQRLADARSIALWSAAVLVLLVLAAVLRGIAVGARRRTIRRRRRSKVVELCDSLVAEMQAGLPAHHAVINVCAASAELAPVVATARLGGDVGAAFGKAAQRPGADGLRLVAASWQVSGRSGAGLAAVLDRVAAALRSDEDAHAEVTAALGPPRATAKMLATLPVVGVVLGTAMGVDPLDFLLTTGLGNGCFCSVGWRLRFLAFGGLSVLLMR